MLSQNPLTPLFLDENQRKFTDEDIRHRELSGGRLEKLHKLSENKFTKQLIP